MAGDAKIRIKVGSLELDYEGDPAFLADGLEALLEKMAALSSQVSDAKPLHETQKSNSAVEPISKGNLNSSTNTIAAHIGVDNGSDLVVCALAYLEFVVGNTSSSRKQILEEMKNATTYYGANYGKNLTPYFATLTKAKRINQIAKDTYALSASEKKSIEPKIAEIG